MLIRRESARGALKWTCTRRSPLTDTTPQHESPRQLALDKDGKFLAMLLDWIVDLGAYLSPGRRAHPQ